MRYTAIDAFCGAGGLCLGLASAGFDVLYSFDLDDKCIETIGLNRQYFSHLAEVQDVRCVDPQALMKSLRIGRGELDLLAGGPPCQGFSMQRTIGGDRDNRNLLVHDYGDLIDALLPKYFLMENVAGLGGKRGKDVLAKFISRMESIGYNVENSLLDARDFGVPQRRKRIIVVGEYELGGNRNRYRWPDRASNPPPTVRDVIAHLPSPPDDHRDHPDFPGHRADRLSEKNKDRLLALQQGQSRIHLPESLVAECHKVSAEKIGHRNVYGRMEWDEVAPTITARFDSFTRGKFGHPDQTRTISLYEGSLLQTFPPDFRFHGNKVDIARQIGNAVPPKFAKALAISILQALDGCVSLSA